MGGDGGGPRTIAAFGATDDPAALGDAMIAAFVARGIESTRPVTIERATEFGVELGGRQVSLLVGATSARGGDGEEERFVSIGRLTFASGRLIGQRDEGARADVAALVDDVLRHDLGVIAEWWTDAAWRDRPDR